CAVAAHLAGIANLAAAFAIERRLVHHHRAAFALFQLADALAVLDQRGDDALGAFGLVAEEFGDADLLAQAEPDGFGRRFARARPRGARLLALAFHRVVERRQIDRDAACAQRILRQIERKTIGVIERESGLAVEHGALLQAGAFFVQDGEAALQRSAETGL